MKEDDELTDVLKRLRSVIESRFGFHPCRVRVDCIEDEQLRFPFPNGERESSPVSIVDSSGETDLDSPANLKHSACINDILTALEKVGKPLTTTRLMAEMAKAGKEWSLSHVAGFLAEMVKDGTLLNPSDARPRGYRLPEWETTSGN